MQDAIFDADVKDEDDIFALGYVNSLFALELVTFVESCFAITIENEDLELENFRSVDAITSFIGRKRGALPGSDGSDPPRRPATGPESASRVGE